MTRHELIQAAAVNWDLFIQSLMVYITVISGYLIAAFLVGNQLTRQQIMAFKFRPHYMAVPLLIIGAVAALKFMWDIRHADK